MTMTEVTPPPPLCKHQGSRENDGHTGSWCLDKAVLPRDARYQKPIPHTKHNCRNRALEHNVQHFFSKFWRSSVPIRGIRSCGIWNMEPFPTLRLILNNCTCLPFGAGFGAGVTTLFMAENHIKTNSSGLQYQA